MGFYLKLVSDPYKLAANQLRVPLNGLCLVAAHAWDIAGAHAIGCRTASLQRPGQGLNPDGPKPDWQATDLVALAQQLTQPI